MQPTIPRTVPATAKPEPKSEPAPPVAVVEPEPGQSGQFSEPAPNVDLSVGQTVLFCVGGGGLYPPVLRPLIVTSIKPKTSDKLVVRGLLVFDSETDRHHPWVQLKSKVTPLVDSPVCWAEGPYGHQLGEWRYPGDLR